jgi:hypothetical protein
MPLRLEGISPAVRTRAEAFLLDLDRIAAGRLHSLYVVGSAVTPDWIEGKSDINVLLLLKEMSLGVIEEVAPLGKRYRDRGVAAPLVMDEHYLHRSLDVFPMEFLELKLIHECVSGEDLLAGLTVHRTDLCRQCEREVKSRLVGLGQGYLASLGEPKRLGEALARFMTGSVPLARGILFLLGKEPPRRRGAALEALVAAAGPDTAVFVELLAVREGRTKPGGDELRSLFERCYRATERLGRLLDEHPA